MELVMPIIRVDMLTGRTLEQKRELARVLTEEAARVIKCEPSHIQIIIAETATENWATLGKLVSDQKNESKS
jgi:4-oxalocrotonate tautomerase